MRPTEPDRLDRPFANEGTKNEIPVEGGLDTGNASLSAGFPPVTQLPITQGGIPPQRADFNGILYVLSSFAHYAQSGCLYSYDAALDYVQNCIIQYNNQLYICVGANGASSTVVTPGTNTNYWMLLADYLYSNPISGNIGSGTQPVYVLNGNVVQSTASAGAANTPIWLNNGNLEKITATLGSATKPIYVDAGALKESGATVGGILQPLYMSAGTLTPLTGSAGSGTQPVYVNGGALTASTATVGDVETPVYLNAGVLTKCTLKAGIADYQIGMPGYVRYDIGLIIQWGTRRTTGNPSSGSGSYVVTFPIPFSSAGSYVITKNVNTTHGGALTETNQGFYNLSATTATTVLACGRNDSDEQWMAIGF